MKVPPTNETPTDSLSIKKIVVAVDLSPHSEVTARYAAEIARSFGASVVLVHVYPVEQVNDFLTEAGYEAREGARQAAEQALADLAKGLRESYRPCEAAFLVGEPAAQVASVAGDLGADLIITASHHPSVLGQLFNRDQAPKIIHCAPCSVLVYHGPKASAEAAPFRPQVTRKVILAPVDLVGESAPALEFAVALAHRWETDLYVLHVYSVPESVAGSHYPHVGQGVEGYRRLLNTKLRDWADRLQQQHPRTFPLFEDHQSPIDCIQETARKLQADLIVISTHDVQGGWSWFLPCSDADGITRRAETPVLVFRPKVSSAPLDQKH